MGQDNGPKIQRGRWAMALLWLALLPLVAGLDALAAPRAAPHSATSVRLIMIEEPGCHFCRKWDTEIAPGYRKSAEGRFAPLKRLRRGASEISGLAPIVYTPTFIVVQNGVEIARLRGYPGEDFFWPLLAEMLARLKANPQRVEVPVVPASLAEAMAELAARAEALAQKAEDQLPG